MFRNFFICLICVLLPTLSIAYSKEYQRDALVSKTSELRNMIDKRIAWHSRLHTECPNDIWKNRGDIEFLAKSKIIVEDEKIGNKRIRTVLGMDKDGNQAKIKLEAVKENSVEAWLSYKGTIEAYVKEEYGTNDLHVLVQCLLDRDLNADIHVSSPRNSRSKEVYFPISIGIGSQSISGEVNLTDEWSLILGKIADAANTVDKHAEIAALDEAFLGSVIVGGKPIKWSDSEEDLLSLVATGLGDFFGWAGTLLIGVANWYVRHML